MYAQLSKIGAVSDNEWFLLLISFKSHSHMGDAQNLSWSIHWTVKRYKGVLLLLLFTICLHKIVGVAVEQNSKNGS